MALQTDRRLSVSTWALHALLGTVAPGRPDNVESRLMAPHQGTLDLLEVPAALATRGFHTMELCHFHVPDRSTEYLTRLREAREAAGVELWSLLIDDGDLAHPETSDRDREWILGWIETASRLGARCVRVIGGKQEPTPENLDRAERNLKQLTVDAYVRGIHVLTENWFQTLSRPEHVHRTLDRLNGAVGLCFDFGNWSGENKYEWLEAIAPYAEGCHAKCNYTDGQPDVEDYTRCLDLTRQAGYSGPYTLVYGEMGCVWEMLDEQAALIKPYL